MRNKLIKYNNLASQNYLSSMMHDSLIYYNWFYIVWWIFIHSMRSANLLYYRQISCIELKRDTK